jgi:hypothetical protein
MLKKTVNKLIKLMNSRAAGFFFEFFTASYDPDINKIRGCRYHSFAWHHEDRHRQQFQNETISKLKHGLSLLMHGSLFALFIGTIMIFILKKDLGLGMWVIAAALNIPYVLFILGLEIDAWVYSVKMAKKRNF